MQRRDANEEQLIVPQGSSGRNSSALLGAGSGPTTVEIVVIPWSVGTVISSKPGLEIHITAVPEVLLALEVCHPTPPVTLTPDELNSQGLLVGPIFPETGPALHWAPKWKWSTWPTKASSLAYSFYTLHDFIYVTTVYIMSFVTFIYVHVPVKQTHYMS